MWKWFSFALQPRRPGTEALYYRAEGFRREGAALSAVRADACLSFDTYFHILPLRKLRAFAAVDALRFHIQSAFRASEETPPQNAGSPPPQSAVLEFWIAGDGWRRPVRKHPLAPGVSEWEISLAELPEEAEALYLRLSSCPPGFTLRGISVSAAGTEAARDPGKDAVAIVICTYRREARSRRNVEYLLSHMGELPLHLYLVDNGKTIPPESFPDRRVSVLPNENTGGSGGFGRGMREAAAAGRFSHLILMDDDIEFDLVSLEKLLGFLRFLKPSCADLSVSGAMLEWNRPCIQFECGARLSPSGVQSGVGMGVDLRRMENLIENDRERPIDYGAWWFLCMPLRYCLAGQYPAPYFFQYDDVEYSLRCKLRLITLNGVSVWHEGPNARFDAAREYFFTRNYLFVVTRYRPQAPPPFLTALKLLAGRLCRQQYGIAQGVILAYRDYLAGEEALARMDYGAKLKELAALNPPFLSDEELRERYGVAFDEALYAASLRRVKKRYMPFLLYGQMIPAVFCRPLTVVDPVSDRKEEYFAFRAALHYDRERRRGYLSRKSFWKFMGTALKLLSVHLRYARKKRNEVKE